MTEPALSSSATIKVWITPPTPQTAKGTIAGPGDAVAGYIFPWTWKWQEARQLIPISSTDAVGGMGSASFRLLRATRQEIGRKAYATLSDGIVVGAWVCITAGLGLALDPNGKPTEQLDPASILWAGWISAIDHEQLAGSTETIGTVSALGLGHILDKRQVYGWAQQPVNGPYGVAINSPPQANMAGPENQVIGNAILTANAFQGGSAYLFVRSPSDCAPAQGMVDDAKIWTRWRLLQHLLAFCTPNMGNSFRMLAVTTDNASPGVNPHDTTIAGYLNDCTYPEVFDLQHLTWKGALDLLIPDAMGLGWYLTVSKTAWTVTIFSISDASPGDATYYGLPVNPNIVAVSLPGEPVTSVTRHETVDDMPDEIVYESAEPCIFGFTIAFIDSNLTRLWTDQQESDYKTAASAAVGYPTDLVQQRELNAAVRAGPGFRDVWTKYGLSGTAKNITRPDKPATGAGALQLIPGLNWNGTVLTIVNTTSRLPYLPTARFLRTLPWPEGLWSDGTDHRDATSIANPQYLVPRVLRYDTDPSTNGGYPWVDLMARNGRPGFISVGLDVDDRSPAVRITANPPELLAFTHWANAGTPAPSDVDPESDGRAIDYTKLVATVAMASDQRIQIIIPRPGTQTQTPTAPGGSNVRRSLIVRDEKLHCWITLKNTILGLVGTNGGQPDYVNPASGNFTAAQVVNDYSSGLGAGIAIRNDWGLAQLRANRLAAFIFRKRMAISIERARSDDQPSWAQLGTLWSKVIETAADATQGAPIAEVSTACGTVVVEVARAYGDRPRMRISTGMPTVLAVGGGGGSPSPTAGGRVSVVGGGTLPQQVQDLRREQAEMAKVTRVPITAARTGSSTVPYFLKIVDGQTVYTNGSTLYYGVKRSATQITTVPSLYDPNAVSSTPGSFTAIDGIGRAQLIIGGVAQPGFVLVCHDARAAALISFALLKDDYASTIQTVSIPLATDSSKVVNCYLPLFI